MIDQIENNSDNDVNNDIPKIESNVENLELYNNRMPFSLSLKISNFENDAAYKKYVKNCEMLIRRCNEYKLWKNYIVDVLHINKCMITNEVIDEVTIEVHHHIPSLYVLASSIINKHIENNEEFCSFNIAYEAIKLHFENRIGYVTLIKSIHEKFHNGYLDIPIELINGNYQYFIKEYSKYMDDDDLDVINSRMNIHTHNCSWSRDNYTSETVENI